jgi:hypothetical protein
LFFSILQFVKKARKKSGGKTTLIALFMSLDLMAPIQNKQHACVLTLACE